MIGTAPLSRYVQMALVRGFEDGLSQPDRDDWNRYDKEDRTLDEVHSLGVNLGQTIAKLVKCSAIKRDS